MKETAGNYFNPLNRDLPDQTRPAREENLSAVLSERNKGLCSTCNNAPACALCKDSDMPVIFCEEFDDSEPAPDFDNSSAAPQSDNVEVKDRAAKNADQIDLCYNCDNRNHCAYDKPEGGVWYCEEYV